MRTSDFRIGTRIGAGYMVLAAFCLALGLLALVLIARVASTAEHLAVDKLPSIQLASELREGLNGIRRAEAKHMLSAERKEMKKLEALMAQTRQRLEALDPQADTLFTGSEAAAVLAAYRTHLAAWAKTSKSLTDASRAGKQDEATGIYNGAADEAFTQALEAVDKLAALSARSATEAWAEAQAIHHDARRWLIGAGIGAFALAAAMAVWVARSIALSVVVPIKRAGASASRIAEGDMTVSLTTKGNDETAQLLRAMESMRERLAAVVLAVHRTTSRLAGTTARIAGGNADLAERTEHQARALAEITASMEELGQAVTQNTDTAKEADTIASNAREVAVRGRDTVARVVSTMNGISDSSRKIADITSIIDSIAFRTNILALNAAVEAARAGEQGRGFAVVAAEVRSLAGRCTEAAREINTLIQASVGQVSSGTGLVQQAGNTMGEVVDTISRLAELMSEVSRSGMRQQAGVLKVGEAVNALNHHTHQNAQLVQVLADNAGELETQSNDLVSTVAIFRVQAKDQAGADLAAAQAAPAPARPVVPRPVPVPKAAPAAPSTALTVV